jgi:hypothetical protein
MDKKDYTNKRIQKALKDSTKTLKALANNAFDAPPKTIDYFSDINKYDLAVLKGICKSFNKTNRDFRCESGIVFENNANIDVDYIFIEVYPLMLNSTS